MNKQSKVSTLLVALALGAGMSLTASAQSSGGGDGGGVTASAPKGGSSTNASFGGWMHEHSMKNSGRVSRQAYMDESGRRWDTMDADKKGLTTAQINLLYGTPGAMGGPTATNKNEKKGITN